MTSRTGRRSTRPRTARWVRRFTAMLSATTVGGLLLLGTPVDGSRTALSIPVVEAPDAGLTLTAADPHRWPGHPGRRLVGYTVKRGDTATGLAVRFHAWTRELRSLNHLGRHGRLFAGERIRIPVVVAAAARAHRHTHQHRAAPAHKPHQTHRAHKAHRAHRAHRPKPHRTVRPWALADVSQAKVRRVVVRVARQHHLDPHLALAVAWQESGWQQRRISSAGAVGVMQVLPGTAAWMASYIGRPLNPYGLYDNVTAGVVLLKVLNRQTGPRKAIASYFQGLGSVQQHGLYTSTKAYVHSVSALHHRMKRGWNPV